MKILKCGVYDTIVVLLAGATAAVSSGALCADTLSLCAPLHLTSYFTPSLQVVDKLLWVRMRC